MSWIVTCALKLSSSALHANASLFLGVVTISLIALTIKMKKIAEIITKHSKDNHISIQHVRTINTDVKMGNVWTGIASAMISQIVKITRMKVASVQAHARIRHVNIGACVHPTEQFVTVIMVTCSMQTESLVAISMSAFTVTILALKCARTQ